MKIGKIISVEFDKFRVKLFHATKTSTVSIEGKVYYFGNIGSYLKVENSIGDNIICEVVAVLDNNIEAKPYTDFNLDSTRELIIKPIGTLLKKRDFKMGVGIFPSIYSDVQIVTEKDIQDILETKEEAKTDNIHNEFTIGTSKNLINYKVKININKFFNIHTAVIGNSGSGKSNTISHILQEIIRKQNNVGQGIKIILFDVNGEYKKAFEQEDIGNVNITFYKPTYEKGYTKFHLPYYLMNLDEWSAFLMASDRTQKPFWDKVLQECYKFYKIRTSTKKKERELFINYFRFKLYNILNYIFSRVDSDTANVTSAASAIRKIREVVKSETFSKSVEVENFLEEIEEILNLCTLYYGQQNKDLETKITELSDSIDYDLAYSVQELRLNHGNFYDYNFLSIASEFVLLEESAKGNTKIFDNTATMLSRLEYFLRNSDCDFMKVKDEYKSEEDYLSKVFSIEKSLKDNQLIILNSSELNRDMLELITSVVNRLIFDYRRTKIGIERRTEPIHIVLDEAHRYIKKDTEYLLKENIFEKIAREGRKYSLYLIISSQRPSELSQTVLSQCGNYIIHRIQNEVDMNYIYSVLPYFSSDYITKIKQSIPGEALIFGNCVPMPLSIAVQQANPEPNSENCIINKQWYK